MIPSLLSLRHQYLVSLPQLRPRHQYQLFLQLLLLPQLRPRHQHHQLLLQLPPLPQLRARHQYLPSSPQLTSNVESTAQVYP